MRLGIGGKGCKDYLEVKDEAQTRLRGYAAHDRDCVSEGGKICTDIRRQSKKGAFNWRFGHGIFYVQYNRHGHCMTTTPLGRSPTCYDYVTSIFMPSFYSS